MEIVELPLDQIKPWENNARIHTKRNLEALKASLTEFKQTKPIIVQKSSMRIIAGNGTYQAIQALGWEKVACHLLDIDDTKAEAYAIADNRTGLLSQWDDKILTESLQKLQENGDLSLSGFDDLELEKMLSFQSGDAFEKISPPPPKQKPASPVQEKKETEGKKEEFKSQPLPEPEEKEDAEYEEQITFSICGFVFSLADLQEIKEIQALFSILKDAPKNEREEVNSQVFEAIKNILTEKYLR